MKFIEYLKWCVRGKEYHEVAFPLSVFIFFASLPFTVTFFSGIGVLISAVAFLLILITIPIYYVISSVITSWREFSKEKEEEKDEVVRRLTGEPISYPDWARIRPKNKVI